MTGVTLSCGNNIVYSYRYELGQYAVLYELVHFCLIKNGLVSRLFGGIKIFLSWYRLWCAPQKYLLAMDIKLKSVDKILLANLSAVRNTCVMFKSSKFDQKISTMKTWKMKEIFFSVLILFLNDLGNNFDSKWFLISIIQVESFIENVTNWLKILNWFICQ